MRIEPQKEEKQEQNHGKTGNENRTAERREVRTKPRKDGEMRTEPQKEEK